MAFYNLRERSGSVNLTDFEAYYDNNGRIDYCLNYHFRVDFHSAYYFSKSLGNKGDEFINDLDKLREDFYNIMFSKLEKGEIKYSYKNEDCNGYPAIYEKDLKKIYDIFLPMQKEFADKWNLYINCD